MEQNQPQPPVFNQQPEAVPQYQPRVTPSPMMDPIEAVKKCLKKFFDFKGRARRSEYWWFVLFTIIVSSVFSFLSGFLPVLAIIGMVVGMVLFIPQLAALTRRLHDTGRSGWWILLLAICWLVVYGAFAIILAPYYNELMTEGDNMKLVGILADAFQSSPKTAMVMLCGSLGTILLFLITFVFSILDSHWGSNKYGDSPKYS